jgi:mannose-1-phosphate guanylyltransferase
VITPVILSGGSGTRLWPLSTPERPKQFLSLVSDDSLFGQTLDRVSDRTSYAAPIVVANAAHEGLCLEELERAPGATLILEPLARNTAVAIVMAAAVAAREDPAAVLLVLPSDHRIADAPAFHEAVKRGQVAAEAGRLVTFGIQPTGPETGYGYLEAGDVHSDLDGAFRVARFKEKPELPAAKAMLAAGGHYWNGGIFMFRADRFLAECAQLATEIHKAGTDAVAAAVTENGVVRPAKQPLVSCPGISVDYAVMERSDAISMVPLDAGWSDVGSWDALADLETPETAADTSAPKLDSRNCFVRTSGPKVALLGVEDLIVIATGDQVVVMKRGSSQGIKQLAAMAANS